MADIKKVLLVNIFCADVLVRSDWREINDKNESWDFSSSLQKRKRLPILWKVISLAINGEYEVFHSNGSWEPSLMKVLLHEHLADHCIRRPLFMWLKSLFFLVNRHYQTSRVLIFCETKTSLNTQWYFMLNLSLSSQSSPHVLSRYLTFEPSYW